MVYNLKSSSSDTSDFISTCKKRISEIIKDDLIGIYIHGSLAMGGFNPNSSDIDVLVVTNKSMTVETKRELAKLLLMQSSSPFPVEISFLNTEQLKVWQHLAHLIFIIVNFGENDIQMIY